MAWIVYLICVIVLRRQMCLVILAHKLPHSELSILSLSKVAPEVPTSCGHLSQHSTDHCQHTAPSGPVLGMHPLSNCRRIVHLSKTEADEAACSVTDGIKHVLLDHEGKSTKRIEHVIHGAAVT